MRRAAVRRGEAAEQGSRKAGRIGAGGRRRWGRRSREAGGGGMIRQERRVKQGKTLSRGSASGKLEVRGLVVTLGR